MAPSHAPETHEIELLPGTGPQMQIWRIDEEPDRCWDIEGSPRAAKSWGVARWIWKLAYRYPGIQIFYCRYKDDDLKTLRDVWAKTSVQFPVWAHPTWNSQEEAWDFPNGEWVGKVYTGSRVYLSSLRVAEAMTADAVHGKYKGKTLAVIVVEEAQEVPRVNYLGLKERLSQSKTPAGATCRYPLKILLVHNCVDEDHWIAQEFPLGPDGDACTREGHRHIRADLYSNAKNLGDEVIAGYEQDYPAGHPLRRTVIEGKRGVTLHGTAVYGTTFKRQTHVSERAQFTPYYPLLEGWDFGEEKPAVVWAQYIRHLSALRIVGAVKGSEMFLELFAPKALEIRRRLFPHATEMKIWCDPTGATGNGGLQFTPIALLNQLGIPAQPTKEAPPGQRDGNDAEVRYKAIQTIGGYMLRTDTNGAPAFMMAPQVIELKREGGVLVEQSSSILTSAFEAGYIWDTHAASDARPNIRKPKKGTRYDDLMNAFEYVVIGEQIPLAPSITEIANATAAYQTAPQRLALREQVAMRAALRKAQMDTHPVDGVRAQRAMPPGRAQFFRRGR